MSQPDPFAQQQEFTQLYASMNDEQLLELRDDYDDLSEIAQPILRDELRRRKLSETVPAAPVKQEKAAPEPDDEAPFPYDASDILLGGVTAGYFENEFDAGLAHYILEQAKIQSAIYTPAQSFDICGIEVRVAPDDGEQAIALLSQPVSISARNEYQAMRDAGDFVLPPCPACGSKEILLESAEPTNQWLCDACGHRWQDALPDPQAN